MPDSKNDRDIHVTVAVMAEQMKNVLASVERIERNQKNNVSKAEFKPVKAIVYGASGSMLLALLGFIVNNAISNGGV